MDRIEDGIHRVQLHALYRLQVADEIRLKLAGIQNFYQLAATRGDFEQSRFVDKSLLVRRPAEGATSRQDDLLSLLIRPDATFREELRQSLDVLDSAKDALGTGPTAADFERLRTLLARVLSQPPTIFERDEFRVHLIALLRRALNDRDEAGRGSRPSSGRGGWGDTASRNFVHPVRGFIIRDFKFEISNSDL